MAQGQSPPPYLRPWYYRNWFLYPAFILGWPIPSFVWLWPAWAVLILRSPWHNGFVTGTLAWAMLMSGGFMIWLQVRESNADRIVLVLLIAPGVIVTVITQALWTRHKRELASGVAERGSLPQVVKGPDQYQKMRSRRRGRRRGGSRARR